MAKDTMKETAKEAAEAVFAPRPAPTPAASNAITDLYMTLFDLYDRDKKAYRNGTTDAVIAFKLGLSETVVRERRELDFGPIVVDTTKEDLARLITLGESLRDELRANLHAALSALDIFSRQMEKTLMGLSDALAGLRKLKADLDKRATP